MDSLRASQFAKYFEAVHGTRPFPWQERLLSEVLAEGQWPDVLAIPTGCGKTSVLDVAVFHLAMQASGKRTAPLRIVSVVDRRTVVDQTFERARRIRDKIAAAEDGVLATVRARLASFSREGSALPLATALLRGGMVRDDSWARSPDQPTLIVSTVDQVGSRLLFRGYGVSDSMKPVHAGLLANDVLYLLDEVHLSNPFAQTLEEIVNRYSGWREEAGALPRRTAFVQMSATPRARVKATRTFELDKADREHPLIMQRLQAAKPVELVTVKARAQDSGGGSDDDGGIVAMCAARAADLATESRAVAVVVNRVATARLIHSKLSAKLDAPAQVVLLTGRMRPLDRQDLDQSLIPRIRAGRQRSPSDPPIVVVSTQCIEAGADFDFDVLITECASLDALRQRFGRLNRLGDALECRGVIVARSDCAREPDPIYGKALGATWEYLRTLKALDLGVDAFKLPKSDELERLLPPEVEAPVLLPAHLDFWVQTRPLPEPDPDVSLWLHGVERPGEPEVQVVWRQDLSEEALRQAVRDPAKEESIRERVEVCSPSSPEGLSLPVSVVRRWLARLPGGDRVADVEGGELPEASESPVAVEPEQRAAPLRYALRWAGDESRVVGPAGLRGGETLVVPSAYGGIAAGNWAPEAVAPVDDVGDRAYALARGKAVLRLAHVVSDPPEKRPPIPMAEASPEDDREAIVEWLEARVAEAAGDPKSGGWGGVLRKHFKVALERRTCRIKRFEELPGDVRPVFALIGRRPLADGEMKVLSGRVAESGSVTTEDDAASFTGVKVSLREHLAGVEDFARDFATRVGLPEERISDLALAGAWHDAGKADRRFQVMLHGGSRFLAEVEGELLAKSATPANDGAARWEASRVSGYPKGARHELASVALMLASERVREGAKDLDLVLHLVASHHGWCRPLAPVVADPSPVDVQFEKDGEQLKVSSVTGLERLDSGVSERFWILVRRYGWFGLAWMEAILRLADHRRSQDEQAGESHE